MSSLSGASARPAPARPKIGITRAGHKFSVPPTHDMFYTLSHPYCWGPAEMLVMLVMLLNAFLFALRLPKWCYVCCFLFWRLSYNLGLGLILRAQSATDVITAWMKNLPPKSRSLVCWAVTRSMGSHYRWARTPIEFNSWLAFRALAMLVLANDGLTYTFLVYKCWPPLMIPGWIDTFKLFAAFSIGFALIGLCVWTKSSAHSCVGDFAWYWGDFFFLIDGNFTFKGVFQFFPHPMYTVGYSAYYGCSLLARSYTLLAVSLAAHLGQIAFLLLVEEPHIQKIYKSPDIAKDVSAAASSKAQANELEEANDKEMIGLMNFDPFRSSDFALAAMILTTVATSALAPVGKKFHLFQLVFWWGVHWVGLGTILHKQSTSAVWTKHFARRGLSPTDAFTHWKRIFNFSTVMNKVAFALVVVSVGENPYKSLSSFLSAKSFAHIAGGLCLTIAHLYGRASAHAALGAFGYFYGDFFLEKKKTTPTYTHIYRYTNNADLLCGHLAHYAIAIVLQSKPIFFISLTCHFLHAFFVYHVEYPHFKALYKDHRKAAALEVSVRGVFNSLLERVPFVSPLMGCARVLICHLYGDSKRALKQKLGDAGRILVRGRKFVLSGISQLDSWFRNSGPYLKAVKIGEGVRDGVRRFDGEEIVNLLERRGVKIEDVDDWNIGLTASQLIHRDAEKKSCENNGRTSCARAPGL